MNHSPILRSICITLLLFSLAGCLSNFKPKTDNPSSTETEESTTSISSKSSSDFSTLILSTEVGTAADFADDNPKCRDLDHIEMHGNPDNCTEYFLYCVGPVSEEIASQSQQVITFGTPTQIKEQYDVHKRSCPNEYLFDGIEQQCMSQLNASCNASYGTICPNNSTIFHKDPVQSSVFIECFPNGTAKRVHCQPLGTIFNEESQTCVKPMLVISSENDDNSSESSEPFSFSLLRIVVWIVSSTNDKLSPWMEWVQLRPGLKTRSKNVNETFSLINSDEEDGEDEDNGETLAYNISEFSGENTKIITRMRKNVSETEFEEDDDDEVLVLTKDTVYLSLYYGVIVGLSILILLTWLGIAYGCSKMCKCCDFDMDEDDEEDEFFKYTPHDKYMMTRM